MSHLLSTFPLNPPAHLTLSSHPLCTGPIIGGISWLRCNMPPGEIHHPDPIPPAKDKYAKKVEEDLEDTDEDEPLLLK